MRSIKNVTLPLTVGDHLTLTIAHFSERELTFTFVIMLSPVRLSVTFVHPAQPVEIFGNVSSPFSTLAIL